MRPRERIIAFSSFHQRISKQGLKWVFAMGAEMAWNLLSLQEKEGRSIMKRVSRSVCALILLAWAGSAYAELQNVSVGGQIRIRGRYWSQCYSGPAMFNRYSPTRISGRAVGPDGIGSVYDWRGCRMAFVEQLTMLHVSMDFTENVSAFVELDSYDIWSEDFRSKEYLKGMDTRAKSSDDVEIFQSYLQMDEVGGLPLSARIGRQSLKLGKGWLVGDYVSATLPLSFDGVRLTYKEDALTVDGFWFKLAETMSDFGKGDVDFYGLYATYKFSEAFELSGYYFYVRDNRIVDDNAKATPVERFCERITDVNDYGATNLHTVGLRANGKASGFDYDLELSYQFGQADGLGAMYKLCGYGDPDAEFGGWGGDFEAGYTFDLACAPRVFVGGCYFYGDDHRDRAFLQYLNPFYRPETSVAFNRLFTGMAHTSVWDSRCGTSTFSNFYQVRTGVSGKISDSLSSYLMLAYYWVADPWDEPANPLSSLAPWWTKEASDNIGLLANLWVQYNYSKDLSVKVGWEHFVTEDGLTDGNFLLHYGTMFTGGKDDNDADYVYFDMLLKF